MIKSFIEKFKAVKAIKNLIVFIFGLSLFAFSLLTFLKVNNIVYITWLQVIVNICVIDLLFLALAIMSDAKSKKGAN